MVKKTKVMVKKTKEEVFMHHPKINGWQKVVLSLPAMLSVSWVFYLQYNRSAFAYNGMELLSPVNTTPLMIALIIFTIGYLIFLLLMFSENIHDFIWRRLGH